MSAFVRAIALALAAIGVLFMVDTFLAAMERSQTRVEARGLFLEGQRLMKAGEGDRASEQFRAALFIERDNREYKLALADAFTAAGRLPEAESTLGELLQRDADGGEENLAMARVVAKEGRMTEAFSYYHRAIYGQWRQNATDNRVRARFELVDLLVGRQAAAQSPGGLLADLLPLEEEAPGDAATRLKLGRLFEAAGSPARAATVFQEVLRENSRDPAAWAGLGDAEFARANYRTALTDFRTALRYRPEDAHASQRAEDCAQVLALDTAQRGLGTEERYQRSVKILELIRDNASVCPLPQELIDTVTKAVKERVSGSRQSAAYESNLDLADKVWQVRKNGCGRQAPPVPEYLELTLNRLTR